MTTAEEVLFHVEPGVGGDVGVATLNRPKALNALNHNMIGLLYTQLNQWAQDKSIKAVVITSVEGRAFCAGGDIRLTYDRNQNGDANAYQFFRDEYQLNRLIFHYPKPYIALLDGITMGGGVGISIHGSHRVGTEQIMFAMPETGIGFFPDVGGTYFLPRLSHYLGYYLGLTGARLKIEDALSTGVLTHYVKSDRLPEVVDAIAAEPFAEPKLTVTNILNVYQEAIGPSPLMAHSNEIEYAFSKITIEEIMQTLHASGSEFAQKTLAVFASKSPTSLKVTLRAFNESRSLSFDACMQQEFRLASHFLEGNDFMEGIRAVVVDKDQQPKWRPNTLDQVSDAMVLSFFSPISEELQYE